MPPKRRASPIWAIPPATVQKMIGAISILISRTNPSPSGFNATANSGQITPTAIPSPIPIKHLQIE